MNLKEVPIEERPREKILKYGRENLTDSELLAIILKTGVKNENVCTLAYRVINEIGSVQNLKNITYSDLVKIKGIGDAKATSLMALSELAKRIYYKKMN